MKTTSWKGFAELVGIAEMASWILFGNGFGNYWSRKRHDESESFASVIDEFVEESQGRESVEKILLYVWRITRDLVT